MKNVLTERQAREYLTSILKTYPGSYSNSKEKEYAKTNDILENVILAHIQLSKHMPFFAKCRYLALMIRRIIEASHDPSKLDDKDYYGNKRLELAG